MPPDPEIHFCRILPKLFVDPTCPSPLSGRLHPGFVLEQSFLHTCIQRCTPGPSSDSGGAPDKALLTPAADDPALTRGDAGTFPGLLQRLEQVIEAFARVVLDCGNAIARSTSPTTHIWAHDLFGYIVNEPEHPDTLEEPTMHFDRIVNAWESTIDRLLAEVQAPECMYERYFVPFLNSDVGGGCSGGFIYGRDPTRRVSFINMLHAVCTVATDAGFFCVPIHSNRALIRIDEETLTQAREGIKTSSSSVQTRLCYIAAAAIVVVLRRVSDQVSSRIVLAGVNVSTVASAAATGVASAAAAGSEEDEALPATSRQVFTAVGAVWKLLALGRDDTVARRDSLYSYIRDNDRGRLTYPRLEFYSVFSLTLFLSYILLARLQELPAVLQTPNDLAHAHEATFTATFPLFEAILKPTMIPDHPRGWTVPLVRALWRMFVRYALLVAVRQVMQREKDRDAESTFNTSSSFRSTLGVLGKSRSLASKRGATGCEWPSSMSVEVPGAATSLLHVSSAADALAIRAISVGSSLHALAGDGDVVHDDDAPWLGVEADMWDEDSDEEDEGLLETVRGGTDLAFVEDSETVSDSDDNEHSMADPFSESKAMRGDRIESEPDTPAGSVKGNAGAGSATPRYPHSAAMFGYLEEEGAMA